MSKIKAYRSSVSAGALQGDVVVDRRGEQVGTVEEIMIDAGTGRVAYVVMACCDGLGPRNKLLALPWSVLRVDEATRHFVCELGRETLAAAPGFDPEHWPDLGDTRYAIGVYQHYGATPYWY